MELLRDEKPAGPVITGFAGRGFRVRDHVFDSGILIDPSGVVPWDAPTTIDQVTVEMLRPILDLDPPAEFLLLGTGPGLVRPSAAFVRAVEAMGIGVEAMDSRAAARAWGVLRQEDRQIVGALLPHR